MPRHIYDEAYVVVAEKRMPTNLKVGGGCDSNPTVITLTHL